jgi:uncharacterized protein (TIGR02271 family)
MSSNEEQHLLGQHRVQEQANARREESGSTLELREEELDARTQAVDVGQVSVGTDVVEEHRTIEVPVTREEVTIERHPVDRRPSDEPIGSGTDVLRVPVQQDQVTAVKQTVIYEELEVGKRAIHDTQHVSETVRKEVVDVDAEGDLQVDSNPTKERTNA